MRKNYQFGEMIFALRKEYKEYENLIERLKKCINIKSDNNKFYFSGLLSKDDKISDLRDRKIKLVIEKNYFNILKKLQYLKYDWYSMYLYSAIFFVEKKDNGLYDLKFDDILTPVDGKKYIPKVDIIDQNKFSALVDELFSSSLMNQKKGSFSNNHDLIILDFDKVLISTKLGNGSFITWDGVDDNFKYSVNEQNSSSLIEKILSLQIPAENISTDWLNLLKKYEKDFEKEKLFDINIPISTRKGTLEVSDIEKGTSIMLLNK